MVVVVVLGFLVIEVKENLEEDFYRLLINGVENEDEYEFNYLI